MKKGIRLGIVLLLTGVLTLSGVNFLRHYIQRQQGQRIITQAVSVARGDGKKALPQEALPANVQETEPAPVQIRWIPAPVTEDPVMETLANTDLDALRQENEEVVGWIHIPGTVIDFPLMQGSDNQFYLEHMWNGTPNVYGSAFLECRNSADFTDYNTIIYGHNNLDGVMFAPLANYADETFFDNHPYIYIVTDGGVLRYEVFATYLAPVDSFTYGLSFNQQSTRERFLGWAKENAFYDTGIAPGLQDRIITLSTCTGQGYENRRVVQARLAMIPEAEYR